MVFLAVAGERQHLDAPSTPTTGPSPGASGNCPPFWYTSTAYHLPPSRTAWTCFTQPTSGRDSASVSVPMLGRVICRWSCHCTRLPSPTWLLNDTDFRSPRRWNRGNPQEPDWCQSGLPFLHWPQRCNAVARRIRPLSSISQSMVAHHSGFSRRSVLARSSTEGHNAPAGDACVASFSRASRALYAHRVAPSCWANARAMELPGLALRIRVLWARSIGSYHGRLREDSTSGQPT